MIASDGLRDVVDDTGRTPVWEAAKHGHQEIVFFLVDAGAHADTADIEGKCSLPEGFQSAEAGRDEERDSNMEGWKDRE